jgi:superfamily I DNA and/or RNA helicase
MASQRKDKKQILAGARIVFATLTGEGSDTIRELRKRISHLIIDEAAQAAEASTLIPMSLGIPHCVFVGGESPPLLAKGLIS